MEALTEKSYKSNPLNRLVRYLVKAVTTEYLCDKLDYYGTRLSPLQIESFTSHSCPYCEKRVSLRFVRVKEDTEKLEFCYHCSRCDTDFKLWRDFFGEGWVGALLGFHLS